MKTIVQGQYCGGLIHRFAFLSMSILATVWVGNLLAQETEPRTGTPSKLRDAPEAVFGQDPTSDELQRQDVEKFLLKEIGDLIPGGLGSGTSREEAAKAAVKAFLDDPEKTVDELEKVKATGSEVPPPSLLIAAMYYSIGNRVDGQRYLEDAAMQAPNLPTIYNAFARLAIADGRRTDAQVLMEKARSLIDAKTWSDEEAKFFELIYRDAMADLRMMQNEYGKVRELLESLVATHPELPKNYMRLAQIDFRQDRIEECLKNLQQFRRLTPDTRVPELLLATMFAQAGMDKQSEEWVSKALAQYSGEKSVVIEYVDWMVAHEKFERALEAIEKNRTLLADSPAVSMLEGKVAFAQERFADAEKIFSAVRVMEPTNIEVSTMLAISMAELGDRQKLEKALEIARQNAQLQSQNPVAMSVLGWLFFKQNNLQGAGEAFNRAVQLGQLPAEASFYIAKFVEARGQKDDALQLVESALMSRGLFLYRKQAEQLRAKLAPADQLAPPKQ